MAAYDVEDFSLGPNVKTEDVYNKLASGQRQAVCDLGRDMAELTVPSIMPPEDYQPGDDLPGNNQSMGSQCVNTLASHLTFLAFPPGQPTFNPAPIESSLKDEAQAEPELWSKLILALSRVEIEHRIRFKATPMETAYGGLMKLLLVAGNGLWKHIKLDEPTFHRPDSYVVKRNVGGVPLLTIHKETLTLDGMDPDHVDTIRAATDESTLKAWDKKLPWEVEVDVYSVMRLRTDRDGDRTWQYWQCFKDRTLPDTEVETDWDNPPMWPAWLIPVYGADWGQGYCEQYRGDLYTMEAHASALNDGASLAALSLIFVKPGSTTSIKQVREAKNLTTLPGDADADISVFRSEKGGDFNFVTQNLEIITRRLSAGFLLQRSITRNAERVTKEEIVRVAQDLDKAMGGLYTSVAQTTQKPIIVRAVRLHEDEADGPPELPTDKVRIEVITGKDSLGQSLEADKLTDYAGRALSAFPKSFEQFHNPGDFFRRLASATGVNPRGLVKDDQQVASEVAQEKQQAMSQDLLSKAAGPLAKGAMDFAANGGDLAGQIQNLPTPTQPGAGATPQ